MKPKPKMKSSQETKQIVAEAVAQAVREAATAAAKAVSDAATATASITSSAVTLDISYIKADIKEIKDVLKANATSFVGLDEWKNHLKRDEDHETRIRGLESFKETLVGKMWGIGIMISAVTGMLSLLVNHFWK